MSRSKLPLSWRLEKIGALCDPIARVDPKQLGLDSFLYVDISSVDNEQKIIKGAKEIKSRDAPSRARQVIATNDVLVSTVRPNLNAVALVPAELDGQVCSTGFCVLRPRGVEPEYLFTWVRHPNFVQMAVRLGRGIGYPAISDDDVRSISIPLPSPPEQRRIIAILREADGLRKVQQQAGDGLKRLYGEIFFQQFGSGEPNVRENGTVKLSQLLAVPLSSGFSPETHESPPGVPIFTLSAVTDWGLDETEIKYYPIDDYAGKGSDLAVDDILIGRSNTLELVGKVGRYRGNPSPVLYSDILIRIRLKDPEDSPYVENYLRSEHMKSVIRRLARGTSGSMKKISQGDINDFDILWPARDERRKYSNRVRELDALREHEGTSRTTFQNLIQSLLAEAFTGDLTSAWREKHTDELVLASTERDRLLSIAFSIELDHSIVVGKPIEIRHAPLSVPGRDQIVTALSDDQRKVLRLALAAEGRFTADTLDQTNAIDPVTVERALRVLAAAGLVMPISLQATSSDDTSFFFCAYRALDPGDHALIEDATE